MEAPPSSETCLNRRNFQLHQFNKKISAPWTCVHTIGLSDWINSSFCSCLEGTSAEELEKLIDCWMSQKKTPKQQRQVVHTFTSRIQKNKNHIWSSSRLCSRSSSAQHSHAASHWNYGISHFFLYDDYQTTLDSTYQHTTIVRHNEPKKEHLWCWVLQV